MKSGPKKQTLKEVPDGSSHNKHKNKFESRVFWRRERRIEKEEIKKEASNKDKDD